MRLLALESGVGTEQKSRSDGAGKTGVPACQDNAGKRSGIVPRVGERQAVSHNSLPQSAVEHSRHALVTVRHLVESVGLQFRAKHEPRMSIAGPTEMPNQARARQDTT